METKGKSPRLSNYELLRIVSMILIVMHHYSYHGGFEYWYFVPLNRVLVQFLCVGGKLGVNCFVLLSGYFLSANTGGIQWKNVVRFLVQVTVFSLVIQAAGWITGLSHFNLDSVLRALFPLLYREWWFANVYLILLLLSPVLNLFVHAADKKIHFQCMAAMLVIWSVIPTLIGAYTEGNDLTWFLTLYIVAAYIRKYNTSFFTNRKLHAILLMVSTFLILLSVLVLDLAAYRQKNVLSMDDIMFLAQMSSPVLTIQSVSLFCLFHTLQMKPSKVINTIASSMFGVYLIHDSNLLRPFLWLTLFENAKYQYSPYLILHAVGAIVSVFVVCTGLSLVYQLTIGKWADRIYQTCRDHRKERPGKPGLAARLYDSIME